MAEDPPCSMIEAIDTFVTLDVHSNLGWLLQETIDIVCEFDGLEDKTQGLAICIQNLLNFLSCYLAGRCFGHFSTLTGFRILGISLNATSDKYTLEVAVRNKPIDQWHIHILRFDRSILSEFGGFEDATDNHTE